MIEHYNIHEHQHRFAAWAASRAASTSKLCRFRVEDGISWLDYAGLNPELHLNNLPEPKNFNTWHKNRRDLIIEQAGIKYPNFSHGLAAKLINIYMKSRFICGEDSSHQKIKAIHPPIDSVLLKALADKNVGGYKKQWREFNNLRWSKYDSDTYEAVIELISEALDAKPLWMIEYYWQGYQR